MERPYRWYMHLSYHQKAFINTVFFSFVLCYPAYKFVYMVASCNTQAEIMGKMDPYFTSDVMKQQIVDYKLRK